MNVKEFYVDHQSKLSTKQVDPSSFAIASEQKGHRYFCIRDVLENPGCLDALEWGFGDLSTCFFFQNFFRSYHAIDIAAEAILKKDGVSMEKLVFGVTEHDLNKDLDFIDQRFDVIIAMMVIEHLFDPFHSFREISRLLKLDGWAFINLPLITSIKNRSRLLLGQMPFTSTKNSWESEEWDGGHLHLFTVDAVRWLGEKYGLSLERIYPVGRGYELKRRFPTLLCNEVSFAFRKK